MYLIYFVFRSFMHLLNTREIYPKLMCGIIWENSSNLVIFLKDVLLMLIAIWKCCKITLFFIYFTLKNS